MRLVYRGWAYWKHEPGLPCGGQRLRHMLCLHPSFISRLPLRLFAVSGSVPEEPVICVKSGHLYERRLIQKAIETTGREPLTGEDITLADLIPVKSESLRYVAQPSQISPALGVYSFFPPIAPAQPACCSRLYFAGSKVVKPRGVTSQSIPAVLTTLTSEWDALLLETHVLRQSLESTRQELSQVRIAFVCAGEPHYNLQQPA